MHKQMTMKTIRLVPLVLAGFCGYLHTVINRRFDEMGALMSQTTTTVQTPSLMDAPNAMLSSFATGGPPSGSTTKPAEDGGKFPLQRVDLGMLQGPAEDPYDYDENTEWKPPPEELRVMAYSEEYQQRLLQYTLDLLPNHKNPTEDNDEAAKPENDDELNPKPYEFNDIDIIVPASGQDERLLVLARQLGVSLRSFNSWYQSERIPAILKTLGLDTAEDSAKPNLDLTFRLLVTRYPEDAQKTEEDFEKLLTQLSERTVLPKEQIKLIRVGQDSEIPLKFNRAHARNVLHQNACDRDDCIVTAFDVDMQVLPIFFHHALQGVKPHEKAYFPIVFSEFNPESVQLVQDFLNSPEKRAAKNENHEDYDPMLEPFSMHRGLWRDFGYGMYVLAGSDAKRFRFNEEHQGWGHEDNDFYKLVHNNMRVDRQREHGLIHAWHTKNCDPGKDIITQQQWIDCLNSRNAMEGSALGLLLRPPLPTYKKEDFPGLAKNKQEAKAEEKPKYTTTKNVAGTDEEVAEEREAREERKSDGEITKEGDANEEERENGAGAGIEETPQEREETSQNDPLEGEGSGQNVVDAQNTNEERQGSPEGEREEDANDPEPKVEEMVNDEGPEAVPTNLRRRLQAVRRESATIVR